MIGWATSVPPVMLHVGDEHHGTVPPVLRKRRHHDGFVRFRQAQAENALKLVDDASHTSAVNDEGIVLPCIDVAFDDSFRFFVRSGHHRPADGCFRVRIAHEMTEFQHAGFYRHMQSKNKTKSQEKENKGT